LGPLFSAGRVSDGPSASEDPRERSDQFAHPREGEEDNSSNRSWGSITRFGGGKGEEKWAFSLNNPREKEAGTKAPVRRLRNSGKNLRKIKKRPILVTSSRSECIGPKLRKRGGPALPANAPHTRTRGVYLPGGGAGPSHSIRRRGCRLWSSAKRRRGEAPIEKK